MKLVELTEARGSLRPVCAVNPEDVVAVINAGEDYDPPTLSIVRFRCGHFLVVAESVMETVNRLRGR